MELLVASSNVVFGIFPLMLLFNTNRYFGSIMVIIAIIMAILMNITRDMPNLVTTKWEKIFKVLDKTTAHITALYGVYLFLINPEKNMLQVIVPIVGIFVLYAADRIKNYNLFAIAQIVWHALAYLGLYLAIPKFVAYINIFGTVYGLPNL